MNAEIIHAPGRFAAMMARMLFLELERAGVSVSDPSTPADSHAGAHQADVYIYVDESGNVELSKIRPVVSSAHRHAEKLFRYPFRVDSFIAAVLHGTAGTKSEIKAESEAQSGREERIFADDEARRVLIDGIEISLTEREYKLFCYLYERRGKPVGRAELLSQVWGGEAGLETNVVEVYVSYLRHKLEGATGKRLILTRRGNGYEFRADGKYEI